MEFPVSPLRDRYLTPFGGCSTDLYPWQVGIAADALRRNTRLASGARVLVSAELGGHPRPLFARAFYEVVALDPQDAPEAARLSPHGEAVFSAFEVDGDARGRSVVPRLDPQTTVVLNASASRFGPTF